MASTHHGLFTDKRIAESLFTAFNVPACMKYIFWLSVPNRRGRVFNFISPLWCDEVIEMRTMYTHRHNSSTIRYKWCAILWGAPVYLFGARIALTARQIRPNTLVIVYLAAVTFVCETFNRDHEYARPHYSDVTVWDFDSSQRFVNG